MSHLTEAEVFALNLLTRDSTASPRFDVLRSCLRWPDEDPPNFSGAAYDRLLDLVIARSFIHKGLPRDRWYAISPTNYFVEVWEEALRQAPNWPGFTRVSLSSADETFLAAELAKPLEVHF